MSQWTHVCGVVRYDDLRRAIYRARPGTFTIELPDPPCGSEGPLTVVTHNGQGGHESFGYMTAVMIFGDLRDFGEEDVPELRKWWDRITTELPKGVGVRQGVLQVEVEGRSPIIWQTTGQQEDDT